MAKQEANVFNIDGNGALLTAPDGVSMAVIDLSTDADTVVSAVPAILLGIFVDVVMSAHTVAIKDNTTTKITLPASTAAGTNMNCYGAKFTTNITVSPNASSTGIITIFYKAI